MSGSAALEIPCLGKQFQLGMLYDCRNECLNHDRRLWDADILNNALVSLPSRQTQCDVFTNDSFDGKMEMVGGANASFKVSLLSGLADVPSGYVNFFKDRVSSKQQARVILKCERIYRHEKLDIDLLRSVPLENGDGEKSATHFVSGVLYGANTFFVFDREVKRNESHANVSSDMKLLISSLSSLHEIPEMDKEEAKKLTCTVYGDNPLSESSISVEQAMKNIGEQRKSHEPVVPIKVFLQPLISVDIEPARFLNEIDVGIISQLQSIIDNFSEIHTRMNILTKTTAFFNFSSIQKKLSKFKEMISQYTNALKKDLSSLLPRVRSGDVEEKELKTVLEERTTTPFCQAYLSSWVDKTEKEVNLLSIYLDYFKGIQFAFEPDELDSVINSLDYDRVVCFSFMIDDFQDKQLQEMYTYLRTGKWNQEPPDESSWCNNQDKRLINDFKTQARRFSKLAKAAEEDNGTKFVVTNISNESKGDKIAVIQMFQDGQPMQFEPDTIPLQALTIDDNAGLSASKTSNVNRRTVFESTKSLRSRDTTVRESAEPDETTQTVQQMSWHFNQGISTKSESDDVRNIRPKLTPSKAYHQNPREVLESRRRDAGTSPSSSWNFQIDEEDVGRNASAKAGSSVHEPEGTKQMLHGSSYDQVRNKWEEQTKMRTSTSSENDSRKLRTKHSDALPSSLKSEIDEEDDFGTNSSAKGTFSLHKREIYPSSFHKGPSNEQSCISRDGMLQRTSAGDATTQAVSAPCQRLAEQMRSKSKKIENRKKEFGSIYKLPTEETMRLHKKMIARKILKNELHGVSSTQERRKEKVLLVMGATGAVRAL
ncbi:hypothetical protein OS493_031220 [Desmophyllum pertusum]|uniref:Uncharacterized protein n=1 Tax=Desmophyllum pertusum TaxID=174260 RepID=A0A9W9ZKK8_9CNID|nr:hypothetical protein OS493_031220 [Desmophyllum pertusum]